MKIYRCHLKNNKKVKKILEELQKEIEMNKSNEMAHSTIGLPSNEIDLKYMNNPKISKQIRDIREERCLSQWKLSQLIGVKVDTIKEIEQGNSVRLETLSKIAQYFGYEVVLKRKEE